MVPQASLRPGAFVSGGGVPASSSNTRPVSTAGLPNLSRIRSMAASAARRRDADGRRGRRDRQAADRRSRKRRCRRGGSGCRRLPAPACRLPAWKMRSARRVGSASWRLRVRVRKSARLQLQRHRGSGESGLLQPLARPSRTSARRIAFSLCGSEMSVSKRRLGADALGAAARIDRCGCPRRARGWASRRPIDAVAAGEFGLVHRLQGADGPDPVRGEPLLHRLRRRPRSGRPACRAGRPPPRPCR